MIALRAQRSLAHRLAPLADRLRGRTAAFGLRPYLVHLVWTRWNGAERGEGEEVLERRLTLSPIPKVEDLTAVSLQPSSAGMLPSGSIRITQVSARYSQDLLMGLVMPPDARASIASQLTGGPPIDTTALAIAYEQVPEPWEFFYEVVEDGRSSGMRPTRRPRFRLIADPFRDAGNAGWVIILERVSGDLTREGIPDRDEV